MNVDEKEILCLANAFFHGSEVLCNDLEIKQLNYESIIQTAPIIVNASFACELYLKYLGALNNGNVMHTHDLSALFDALSEENKDRIINSNELQHLDDFRGNLELLSGVFVDWRYLFEHNKYKTVDLFFISDFPNLLNRICNNIK